MGEINDMIREVMEASRLEREIWGRFPALSDSYNASINAPEGYTFSSFFQTTEYLNYRKQWLAAITAVENAKNRLGAAIRELCSVAVINPQWIP